jgi:hypothetical protein
MFADGTSGNERYRGYIGYAHNTGSDNGEHMQFAASGGTGLMRFYADGLALGGETATANRLNDYEEGYHTPTIVGSTSGSWTTSTYTTLTYTKIGRVVHIGGYLNISSESSPSGAMRISLPVAVGTFTHDSGNNSLSISLRGHNGSTALYNVTAAVSEGTSYMELIAVNGTGGHTWIGDGQIDGSANIRIGGHYFTD